MHDVENVLGDTGFWTAFVVAVVGLAVVWIRMRRGGWEPGPALVLVVATLVGLRADHLMPALLVVGVALLVAGECASRGRGPAVRLVALVPGAVVLGVSLHGWPGWMRVVTAFAVAIGGVLAGVADERAPRVMLVLLAVGAAGVYVCVPDTEAPKVLLGALVVGAVLTFEPRVRHGFGVPALVGLFVWVATFGGLGRDGSVVGGIACLGVVVLLPLAPRWAQTRRASIAAVVVQLALVAWVSRVAGLEQSAGAALLLTVPAFAAAGLALRAWRWR